MKKVKLLNVNSQEGLLLFLATDSVIGGYSHHNQVVIINVPWQLSDIELPDAIVNYKVIQRQTDNCSVVYWHSSDQYLSAYDVLQKSKR